VLDYEWNSGLFWEANKFIFAPKGHGRVVGGFNHRITHAEIGLGLRQIRVTHQPAIYFPCTAAAFVEGPDDEGLATAAVARGEDAFD